MKRDQEFRYMKLAGALRDQILSGYIQPGQFLLSENELCRHYGLSRSSVRKALDQLLEEGLITKRVGQGTIVSTDLDLPQQTRRTLRILATSPSYFAEIGLPIIQQEFARLYPQVEVSILSLPNQSFYSLFETSKEMGFRPDLLFVSERQYHELQLESTDDFVPLGQLLQEPLNHVYPRLAQGFGGQAIAAPVTFSPVYLVYNPHLFERSGIPLPHSEWTMPEFLDAARAMTRDTDDDGIKDTYGLSLQTSLSRWPALALRHGVRFRQDDAPEALLASLTSLHDLVYRHRVAALASRTWLNSEAFIREKIGMTLTTSIELAGWKRDGLPFEPRLAPLPLGSDEASLLIANAFMIPKDGESPDLAAQFLKVALSTRTQQAISEASAFLSVLPPVNEALLSQQDLHSLGLTGNTLDHSLFLHELLPDPEIMEELDKQMDLFWAGLESAETSASRLREILGLN
ncbi:extracellular solute-binding protein [Paenibacillus daejeonensis]|uniref:extracellular solute-binding protein n=1 Tax=Paenibacillus daejeonensis TaxID=135193 RepID=UPI0003721473|nr:extracellular solute-binding protein [Paenibacillus daejeonensis]